jgi:dihydrofolate synthase / folylpolyglutamate synthase
LSGPHRSLADWLAWQQQLHPRSIDLGLGRVRTVAERLGLLPVPGRTAIVAGTNGKGSTTAMLAALARAHGHSTCRYSSPHLVHYAERIAFGGGAGGPAGAERLAGEGELVGAFERIEAARGSESLTFFEFGTLAALVLGRDAQCEATVLEVGLGGRLDATNIVDAEVAVLCSIGLDHRDWLGPTLEDIGREKAGVFRAGQQVVLGSDAMPVTVHERLAELTLRPAIAGRDFHWQRFDDGRWDYHDAEGALSGLPQPALAGRIQYRNAATAMRAARALLAPRVLDAGAVAAALAGVQLPGRLQFIPGEIEWVLDVAHNEPAAAVLAAELAARPVRGRTIAVLGMLGDKDAAAVVQQLRGCVQEWVLCSIDEPRGLGAAALQARLAPGLAVAALEPGVAQGCARAAALAVPGDRILACGSFHTVGPALQWLGLY